VGRDGRAQGRFHRHSQRCGPAGAAAWRAVWDKPRSCMGASILSGGREGCLFGGTDERAMTSHECADTGGRQEARLVRLPGDKPGGGREGEILGEEAGPLL
jgi:hypothetical protein